MNSVTVDASHYERLVRDSVKYEQLRALMIKSAEFSKYFEHPRLDDEVIMDGLNAIFSSSEFNDMKIRWEYLKSQYEEEQRKKEAEKKAAEQFDKNSAYPESVKV